MTPVIFFVIILAIQLLLYAYFSLSNSNDYFPDTYNESPEVDNKSSFKGFLKNSSFFNPNESNTKKSANSIDSSTEDIEKELKKCRRRLKRNLMTLNYMSNLKLNSKNVQETAPIDDIPSMRKKLQLDIIRNSRLIMHYRSLMV